MLYNNSAKAREGVLSNWFLPGDFPGEAPQKTHILTERAALLAGTEFGFKFESPWLVWKGESPSIPPKMDGAGDAPPDAIL